MAGEVRTQGMELYILDTTIKKIINVDDIGEFGPQADDIETTNYDSVGKEFITGLADNGEATIRINVIPDDPVHQLLFAEAGTGRRFQFAVCGSEGATDPTVSGGAIVPPLASVRTTDIFTASIKTAKRTRTKNEIVRGNITLRLSGGIATTWYDPA